MTDTTELQTRWPRFVELAGTAPVAGDANALAFVREQPMPTTRQEFWKYTRLGKLRNAAFSIPPQPKQVELPTRTADTDGRLVFVNGQYMPVLSDIARVKGLSISQNTMPFTYREGQPDRMYFRMLNRAIPTATVGLEFDATDNREISLEILHIISSSGALQQPALYARVNSQTKVRIYEHFSVTSGASDNLFNGLLTISADKDAQLNWTVVQEIGHQNTLIQNTYASQETRSRLILNTVSFNALLLRNNVWISSENKETYSRLNGITLCGGESHTDHHTYMDHRAPQSISHENYRMVLGGQATGVFNGKVMVRQDAQKINAYQNNRNMLLTETARINTKPELEIYADDVKCSHGSTTGRLDDEALFYLRSRGIGRSTAIKLLIDAFFSEILADVPSEVQRLLLSEQVRQYLDKIQ